VSRSQLQAWLKDGADINRELSDAVLASDDDRIAYLLDHGAAIDKRDDQGYTPLASAARLSSLSSVELLLSRGANPNIADSDGWTPLLHAVLRNDTSVLHALLQRGARIDIDAPGGYPALCIALEEARFDAAQVLADAGAPVNTRAGHTGITPLMILASEKPTDSRIKRLQQKLGPIELARTILSRHADINAVTGDGITALMIAASQDNAPMAGLLLQANARTDMRSHDGETARQIAVRNNAESVVRIIDLMSASPKR
jgi:ankyrin repeat protein